MKEFLLKPLWRRKKRSEMQLRRAEMTPDDRDMMSSGMERFLRQRRKNAESPMTSPESYSPTDASPTDANPKTEGPSSAGTGDQLFPLTRIRTSE